MALDRIRLGIDFGTSNTVAVLRWPDGRARPLLFDGSPLLPSAVYAEPGGALVVGRDAVHSARLEPARFEPNPKRRIDDGTVLLGDRELPVGELITAVLSRVDEERRRAAGDVPVDVTVTCPASWGATRRLVLADAASAAGLGSVRLVAEPVAAATYFTKVLGRDVPIGSVVVVHDFGAGTFDASVVARTSSGFSVLAVDGRDDIGGLDVDEALVGRIGEICATRDPVAWQRLAAPTTVEERRARRLLWDDARIAKERLSRGTTADITVPLLDVEVHLTRDELEALAQPLLEQTVRVTQSVMRWAKLAEGRVAGVFLVGGSSRIPLMATLLHRAIGEAPVAIEQPELVVAEGSMLASERVAVAEAPAPGPATGQLPVLQDRPVSGSGSPAPAPGSGSPVAALAPGSPVSVSGVPVSGSPVSVSGVPVSGSPVSVSGVPVSGAPVSGGPATPEPEAKPVPWVGRAAVRTPAPPEPEPSYPTPQVYQQPPRRPVAMIRPMARYEQRAPLPAAYVEPQSYPVGPQRQQPQLVDAPVSGTVRGSGGYRSGRHPVTRMFGTLLIMMFLAAVPVVSGYIAFKMIVGEPPLPVDLDPFLRAIRRLAT